VEELQGDHSKIQSIDAAKRIIGLRGVTFLALLCRMGWGEMPGFVCYNE
jgi:hypothetical protein